MQGENRELLPGTVKGPKMGPYIAPRFPSLITPSKERNRLDWKMRSELASGEPQRAGRCCPVLKAYLTVREWSPPGH